MPLESEYAIHPPQKVKHPFRLPRKVGGWEEEDIIAWATGEKSLSKDKKGHPRILSVIGPPGSGKTSYLRDLRDQLDEHMRDTSKSVIITLYLDLTATLAGDEGRKSNEPNRRLSRDLKDKLDKLAALDPPKKFKNVALSRRDVDNSKATLVNALLSLCNQNCLVLLLVDQVEDIPNDDWQYDFERNVIAPILNVPKNGSGTACTRVIIARRDEQKLLFDQLKWIDMAAHLEPLTDDQPAEQIRRRLDFLIRDRDDAFVQLYNELRLDPVGLPEAKINEILNVAATNREMILQRLGGKLTGNPLMNLQLLYQLFLKDGDAPITADELSIVLETYWRRAGLADTEHAELREVLLTMANGWGEEDNWNPSQWTQVDYARLHSKGRVPFSVEALAPAFEAGVIIMREITRRYQLDPTLLGLAKGLHNAPQQGGGQS